MMTTSSLVRLMLISAILFLVPNICTSAPHANKHHHEDSLLARAALSTTPLSPSATPSGTVDLYSVFLSGSASPCSGTACATATPPGSPGRCPSENNTSHSLTVEADVYTVICDVDFVDQNIYPFVLATSFEACLTQCVQFNSRSTNELSRCVGFVYAPDRVHDADDCYLKSSLNSAISATISLIGATLGSGTSTTRSWKSTSSPGKTLFIFSFTMDRCRRILANLCPAVQLSLAPTISASLAFAEVSTLQDAAAVRQTIKVPSVSNVKLHGPSKNTPTTQYIAHPPASPIKLASSVLVPGINSDLTNEYQIAGDTGTLTSSLVQASLADLSVVPHLSRDGGKGGEINGTHIFIFCDTAGFTTANASHNGDMVSFVSSSVAVDLGMDGLNGEALTLVDGIGEWQDDVGRLRGYAPMTTGEEAFNIALSGDGYRYALWPETSLIPLNSTHSIQYASLVYDEVNMTTQAAAFTSLGTSLLTVWVDPDYGPAAERTVNRLFSQDDVAWGSMGGIRAWGSTGVGGTDGKVYVFGKAARDEGLLLARTTPSNIADRSQVWFCPERVLCYS